MSQSTQSSRPRSRWEKILTTGLIVAGIILIVFFGLRAVRSFLRIQFTRLEPGVTNVEQIRGWMTVPYIAHAYHVPSEYIFEQIDIPLRGNEKKSLRRLNQEYASGEPGLVLEAVKDAIRQYQAENPPPIRWTDDRNQPD